MLFESSNKGNEVDGIYIKTNQEVLSMDSRSKGTLDNMVREEEEYEVNHDKEVMKTSKILKDMT